MPRVSQIYIETKRLNYFISNLWNTITLIENRDEAVSFLKELLTQTEVRMLAKRIQVAKMLLEGYKYQDIIPHVRVTSGTISTVNNQLQFGNGGYIKILERLIKMEQKKQKKIEEIVGGKRHAIYPRTMIDATSWTADKLRKKFKKYSKNKSVEKEIE